MTSPVGKLAFLLIGYLMVALVFCQGNGNIRLIDDFQVNQEVMATEADNMVPVEATAALPGNFIDGNRRMRALSVVNMLSGTVTCGSGGGVAQASAGTNNGPDSQCEFVYRDPNSLLDPPIDWIAAGCECFAVGVIGSEPNQRIEFDVDTTANGQQSTSVPDIGTGFETTDPRRDFCAPFAMRPLADPVGPPYYDSVTRVTLRTPLGNGLDINLDYFCCSSLLSCYHTVTTTTDPLIVGDTISIEVGCTNLSPNDVAATISYPFDQGGPPTGSSCNGGFTPGVDINGNFQTDEQTITVGSSFQCNFDLVLTSEGEIESSAVIFNTNTQTETRSTEGTAAPTAMSRCDEPELTVLLIEPPGGFPTAAPTVPPPIDCVDPPTDAPTDSPTEPVAPMPPTAPQPVAPTYSMPVMSGAPSGGGSDEDDDDSSDDDNGDDDDSSDDDDDSDDDNSDDDDDNGAPPLPPECVDDDDDDDNGGGSDDDNGGGSDDDNGGGSDDDNGSGHTYAPYTHTSTGGDDDNGGGDDDNGSGGDDDNGSGHHTYAPYTHTSTGGGDDDNGSGGDDDNGSGGDDDNGSGSDDDNGGGHHTYAPVATGPVAPLATAAPTYHHPHTYAPYSHTSNNGGDDDDDDSDSSGYGHGVDDEDD